MDDRDQPEPIDEGAVQAVADAMAKAHHGPDVTDSGGYLQDARSFVAAAMALRDYRPPEPAELPAEPLEAGGEMEGLPARSGDDGEHVEQSNFRPEVKQPEMAGG